MSLLDIFKKAKLKRHPINIAPGEVSRMIISISINCSKKLIEEFKDEYDKYFDHDLMESLLVKNHEYLLFHMTRRVLLIKYGLKYGNELFDVLMGSFFNLIGENMNRISLDDFASNFIREYKEFENEYFDYTLKPVGPDPHVLKDTIYWEFGKKVTEIMFGKAEDIKYISSGFISAAAGFNAISAIL